MAEEESGPMRRLEVRLPARDAVDPAAVERAVAEAFGGPVGAYRVVRRTLDARRRPVRAVLTVEAVPVGLTLPPDPLPFAEFPSRTVHRKSSWWAWDPPASSLR
jgi:hypothetical protein